MAVPVLGFEIKQAALVTATTCFTTGSQSNPVSRCVMSFIVFMRSS
jgi:hypothetical protein